MYPRPIRINPKPNSKIGVKIWKKSTSDNLNIERLRDFHNNVPLTKNIFMSFLFKHEYSFVFISKQSSTLIEILSHI